MKLTVFLIFEKNPALKDNIFELAKLRTKTKDKNLDYLTTYQHAIALCVSATDETKTEKAEPNKEKRQSQEGTFSHLVYRSAKQEQIAPVEEPQEEDRVALRNRTSLQPASKDPGEEKNRPGREPPKAVESSTTVSAYKNTNEQNSNSIEATSEASKSPHVRQVDIEHRGLSLEDRRQSQIPPPKDGISYTPEEFTSLIIAGYAVTPILDFNFDEGSNSIASTYSSTKRPLVTTSPYSINNLPSISSPTPFTLRDEQTKINQARLELGLYHYRQRLALQQSLPPSKNSRGYTPDEFNSLIAAGYDVTPVPVNPYDGGSQSSRADEEYRPGQVFSLNPQELLDLQPERKAPLPSNQYLQHLYGNQQQEHKQNLQQQIYYVEPQSQSGRQAPPSHAVIARPHFSLNGGEASVGAALSVSDSGSNSRESFNQELLALLGQSVRPQESRPQPQSSTVQSVAPQYQQIDRYITKPSKKPTKLRSKVRFEQQPQATAAPQQYLIETTNVQQQPQQQQQYRPTQQPQRLAQNLRYVPIQQSAQLDQFLYEHERPESQGLKIVPAPKLAPQLRPQFNYRLAPQASQYQQQEATPQPKQYRLVELPRAPIRQELRLPTTSNIERPLAYLKRLPENEKQRSVKIYDPIAPETQQPAQLYGEQFVLRPLFRSNEQRPRYEISQPKLEQSPTKAPHSSIYVSKNIPLRSQKLRPQSLREQNLEQSNIEIVQHGQSLEEQRSQLPPPKNNKAYTPEEFAALVAAGYSVTPVPVSALNLEVAQSRTETVTVQPKRRMTQRRRNQYLPVRDDAP